DARPELPRAQCCTVTLADGKIIRVTRPGARTSLTKEGKAFTLPGADHPNALSLLLVGEGYYSSFTLPERGAVRIGRSRKCQVGVEHPSISREHAILHVGPVLEFEDCGSRNGSSVRGQALPKSKRVRIVPDEMIEIGALKMVVQLPYQPAQPQRIWTHAYFE